PGTSVTRDGKGHLGPPGDRSAQAAVERVDEPQLDAISNRLALRIGGDPQPKTEGRGERCQVFETRPRDLVALQPSDVRPREACGIRDDLLREAAGEARRPQ